MEMFKTLICWFVGTKDPAYVSASQAKAVERYNVLNEYALVETDNTGEEVKNIKLPKYEVSYTHNTIWIGDKKQLISTLEKSDPVDVDEALFEGSGWWLEYGQEILGKVISNPAAKQAWWAK